MHFKINKVLYEVSSYFPTKLRTILLLAFLKLLLAHFPELYFNDRLKAIRSTIFY